MKKVSLCAPRDVGPGVAAAHSPRFRRRCWRYADAQAFELSILTGTQILLLVVSETGLVYTFTTAKLQPIVQGPEGKALIQVGCGLLSSLAHEVSILFFTDC